MKTITMTGVGMTDEIHQLDPTLSDEAIMWNITRMMRDALNGAFGAPINRPLSVIPAMEAANTANIDWHKVRAFCSLPFVLGLPILTVEHDAGPLTVRRIVDGNHRICARQRAGLFDFDTYLIPSRLEKNYRVRFYEDGVEIPLPYDD